MLVVCPDCGADGQEIGKYCENCGRLLDEAALNAAPGGISPAGAAPATPTTSPTAAAPPQPDAGPPPAPAATTQAPTPFTTAQFAVVRNGQVNPSEGFTITRTGEFLVGRLDTETNSSVDVDVRQWIQPVDVGGARQYLIHRHQCYLGLTIDGVVTVRACQGAEGDTLVRPVGSGDYTPLAQLDTVRTAHPDATPASIPAYPLTAGDRLYLGDPDALRESESGNAKAQGTYLMLELLK